MERDDWPLCEGKTAMKKAWHVVTYDVRDEGRLRIVARLLQGYGERIQYSVFRCRLSKTDLGRLRWELSLIMAPEDDLLVIPLCEHCAGSVSETSGRHWDEESPTYRIV